MTGYRKLIAFLMTLIAIGVMAKMGLNDGIYAAVGALTAYLGGNAVEWVATSRKPKK